MSIWDTMLPMATFAYNSAFYKSIKEIPFMRDCHEQYLVPAKGTELSCNLIVLKVRNIGTVNTEIMHTNRIKLKTYS